MHLNGFRLHFECIFDWIGVDSNAFSVDFDGSCNEFQLMFEGIVAGRQYLLDGFQCILVRFPWHLGWISMPFEWIPNAFSVDFQCILDRLPWHFGWISIHFEWIGVGSLSSCRDACVIFGMLI